MKNNNSIQGLINVFTILIIIYFLHAYDYLSTISFRTGLYFWKFNKNITDSLGLILSRLNTFTYLEEGLFTGTLVYLLNYTSKEKVQNSYKNNYLSRIKLPFLGVNSLLIIFLLGFSFISQFDLSFLKNFLLFELNFLLYLSFLSLLIDIIQYKWSLKERYLIEVIAFPLLIIEILISNNFSISLFPKLEISSSLVLLGSNFLFFNIKRVITSCQTSK